MQDQLTSLGGEEGGGGGLQSELLRHSLATGWTSVVLRSDLEGGGDTHDVELLLTDPLGCINTQEFPEAAVC